MKYTLTSIFCVFTIVMYSQISNEFPIFLEGVWQAEQQKLI